ncbi:hypothetical protein N9L68_01550 [bacterium]|nr:hypothetical protein [bacterium]
MILHPSGGTFSQDGDSFHRMCEQIRHNGHITEMSWKTSWGIRGYYSNDIYIDQDHPQGWDDSCADSAVASFYPEYHQSILAHGQPDTYLE